MSRVADVAVIGAGVVGAALARHLGSGGLEVIWLEAKSDVGDGTSKANTGILHTGFDASPGTLEARLVRRGYELLARYCEDSGVALERTGALMVAWTSEEVDSLAAYHRRALENGVQDVEWVDSSGVYRREPHLAPGALAGLYVPGESLICTWSTTLAYARDALNRGVELSLNTRVEGWSLESEFTRLTTTKGEVLARWVVNAAGLESDWLDQTTGRTRFHVTPRRGELVVYDKAARSLVSHIVLPVPTSRGKGVLVSPTVYGNVMVGPTAEDLERRDDTSTSPSGLAGLRDRARQLLPELDNYEVTALYAGLRAATEFSDYVIDVDGASRYALVGGIRSTGLTASLAIAEHVIDLMRDAGLTFNADNSVPPPVRVPNLGVDGRPSDNPLLVAHDPGYGEIVCFCEQVSRAEIRDALSGDLPATSLGGVRRRTRAMNGRCQGFYCAAEVLTLLKETRGPT